MENRKSSLQDLESLFERQITVASIAEPLLSFDGGSLTHHVRQLMEDKNFDIVGVRHDGTVDAYVEKTKLAEGILTDHAVRLALDDVVPQITALYDAFELLKKREWFMVSVFGRSSGIVTRGDLQKTPVCMWLFGLVSLLELHGIRVIREFYKDDSWTDALPPDHLKAAEKYRRKHHDRNEALDLVEYISLADILTVLHTGTRTSQMFILTPPSNPAEITNRIKTLRDNIAHGHDITSNGIDALSETINQARTLLDKLEALEAPSAGTIKFGVVES